MFQRSNHEKNQEKQLVGILLHLPRQKDACRGFLVSKKLSCTPYLYPKEILTKSFKQNMASKTNLN